MVAEGVGFEPTLRFPVNTLSKRAPSATRPPLLTSSRKAHAFLHEDAREARFRAFSHSATPPQQLINRSCRSGQPFSSPASVDPLSVAIDTLNAMMGLPPVVVGLAVFLALSRSGPLGSWGLLFTPQAMVIAQTLLVAPIIAALTRQTIEDLWVEYRDELAAMNVGPAGRVMTLVWDARFSLVTALLAGFGRAAAEVGAIIIVGGNIDGFTRTMTTAIALETSKGDLPLAVGLGMVLIFIVILINALAWGARRAGERYAG